MARLMDIHNRKKAEKAKAGAQAPKPPEPATEPIAQGASSLARPEVAEKPSPAHSMAPPAPHVEGAYERDLQERTEFDKATHAITEGTAPRLRFGQVLTSEVVEMGHVRATEAAPCDDSPRGHAPGYIWGLGKRPRHMAGPLQLVGAKQPEEEEGDAMLYRVILEASKQLKEHSLPLESGPYAEHENHVKELADAVFRGAKDDILILIERIIDMRPFTDPASERANPRFFRSFPFVYHERVETPDVLPTAGVILSQDERLAKEHVTGAGQYRLVHPMEPYILATALLRARGINAYPAQAVVPDGEGGEASAPLLAIIDLAKEVPLMTFDMFRAHPAMGAIDILSDTAVQGATYAMLAEARVRHLVFDMVRLSEQGQELSADEFGNQLNRIARMLFESVKRWDGNPFIPRAMTLLGNSTQEAVLISDINRFRLANDAGAAAQVENLVRQILHSGTDPQYIRPSDPIVMQARDIAIDVYNISGNAVNIVQTLLGAWISKATEGQKAG